MKIHEYQAKEILAKFGIPCPRGHVVDTAEAIPAAVKAAQTEFKSEALVVKAQIHAGGRGKGGGVKFCKNTEAVLKACKDIYGMQLITPQTGPEGQKVRKLYLTDPVDIASEFYLAVTLDRAKECPVIIASAEGGMDIEEVAKSAPEKIIREWVDPVFGIRPYQSRRVAVALGFTDSALKAAAKIITNLYKCYEQTDAALAEINPLVLTPAGEVTALDAKFSFDDNALYRHPEIAAMRDINEEDPAEVEASKFNLNYIKLDGNVGCMVNGAGLAMATMDIIKLKGGEPANFLDVGGTANPETVSNGFRIILSDPAVKAVLINIFGGIVRCDRIANGVVDAVRSLDLKVPVVVRLQGTNAEEARKILAESGVAIVPADTLDEAATKVMDLVGA